MRDVPYFSMVGTVFPPVFLPPVPTVPTVPTFFESLCMRRGREVYKRAQYAMYDLEKVCIRMEQLEQGNKLHQYAQGKTPQNTVPTL